MNYLVKEIFYTLQGEGANTGRPAVFCRFAGCNLWSGREQDRHRSLCTFCDTDFVGTNGVAGGRFPTAHALADRIEQLWPSKNSDFRFVVLTGGEPLLQVDETLTRELKSRGFWIALETNGTLEVPPGIDWICVSPKGKSKVIQKKGHELKLVFPQAELDPSLFSHWEFERFYLQPMDGPSRKENLDRAIQYCQANPRWNLSVQVHKSIGIQ